MTDIVLRIPGQLSEQTAAKLKALILAAADLVSEEQVVLEFDTRPTEADNLRIDGWTVGQIVELKALLKQGCTQPAIAKKVGRTLAGVKWKIKDLRAKGELSDLDEQAPEPSQKAPSERVSDRRGWSKGELQTLAVLKSVKASTTLISEVLDRTENAVMTKASQLRSGGILRADASVISLTGDLQAVDGPPEPSMAEQADNLRQMTARQARGALTVTIAPRRSDEQIAAELKAACAFLNEKLGARYSIFPRGPDRWLMNGVVVLNDAQLLNKARNHGFKP